MNKRQRIIIENIEKINSRINAAAIKSGRSLPDITLLAVTKNVGIEDMRTAIAAGIKVIGENKVQEATKKFAHIGPTVTWHMVGHLQTNKARQAAELFDLVQSIDSARVADCLDREAGRLDRQLDVLVEVNIGAEEQKFGIPVDAIGHLIAHVQEKPNLRLRGLMSMAPFMIDDEWTRPFFREMSRLFGQFRNRAGDAWQILSMGMSKDFEVAIEEGATLVRIGTAIFHTPELRRQD